MILSSGPRPWRRFRFDGAQIETGTATLPIFGASNVTGTWKTTEALATASISTVLGLARTSIKTFQGLTP